jgi:ubiquinone/menaquinone biosynthesis C-methylase UbiE
MSDENLRYLHVGCGNVILPKPFENLDVRPADGVMYISPAYPLPFDSNTFDLVYSSHVLEHFKRNETQNVLNEWVRVLKPSGIIRLSVPSIENLMKIYQKSGDLDAIIGPLMGGQTYEQNFHYNAFDTNILSKYLINAGCEAVHTWDYRRTSHSKFFDFSQAIIWEIPISLNLEARKALI